MVRKLPISRPRSSMCRRVFGLVSRFCLRNGNLTFWILCMNAALMVYFATAEASLD